MKDRKPNPANLANKPQIYTMSMFLTKKVIKKQSLKYPVLNKSNETIAHFRKKTEHIRTKP